MLIGMYGNVGQEFPLIRAQQCETQHVGIKVMQHL